jgi:hypothetical protein
MSIGAEFDPQRLYDEARRVYAKINPPVRKEGGCLYWSLATVIAAKNLGLEKIGYEFQVQAGTASFIRIRQEDDDGVIDNAFGYEFEDNSRTAMMVALDQMPEMHCWVGCAKTGTLFDPTTGFLPEQCRETAKMAWLAPDPPPFVCFTQKTAPWWAFYTPSMKATGLAHMFIGNFMAARREGRA